MIRMFIGMTIPMRGIAVSLLSLTSLGAADLRLIEAVKRTDQSAVHSLLDQKVDVNATQPDGTTALAWAAHLDDLNSADALIRAGARANLANQYGATPLWIACSESSAAMVEKLLEAGSDPNIPLVTGETPLMAAAHAGNAAAIKLLVAAGAKTEAAENKGGQTALMWAAAAKHPGAVAALIAAKADVHARSKTGFSGLLFAASQGDLPSVKILLAAGSDVNEATAKDGSALVLASASGNEELALYLLDHGANPNAKDDSGVTALHYAMLRGLSAIDTIRSDGSNLIARRPNMLRLVDALIAHGADPNARVEKLPRLSGRRNLPETFITAAGATPYMLAAASYDAKLMRLLVDHGADPRLVGDGKITALILAAGLHEVSYWEPHTAEQDRKALECVKLAIELGADVNSATVTGDTALHAAAYTGSTAIIQYLVDHGARLDAEDTYGQTPLVIAERLFASRMVSNVLRPQAVHPEAADLLMKLGARLPDWAAKQKADGLGRAASTAAQ
jgi:hypothetical protein